MQLVRDVILPLVSPVRSGFGVQWLEVAGLGFEDVGSEGLSFKAPRVSCLGFKVECGSVEQFTARIWSCLARVISPGMNAATDTLPHGWLSKSWYPKY